MYFQVPDQTIIKQTQYGWSKAMLLLPGAKLAVYGRFPSVCLGIYCLNVRQNWTLVYHVMVSCVSLSLLAQNLRLRETGGHIA